MKSQIPEPSKSILRRYKLVLWKEHQPYIAWLLVVSFIGMSLFFGYRAWVNHGLVDIDTIPKATADYRVDINTADWYEIVVLPGVGEKLAKAIVEFRQQHGHFASIDSIEDVPGIGESKLAQLRPFLLPIHRP